ncbi:sugar transferase [Rhodococcus sp. H36-A4]|uniref:sugar transferase n=1 Tax=Rhodococcus sp. H36-A4 TaxID=3004353 RepID=UPI0022B00F45|nr:sugar transferase [Rhodococcus sp. H36-A4]MCZ4076956.1 sugar transferase [Rhodococcus sp. H36-A4]
MIRGSSGGCGSDSPIPQQGGSAGPARLDPVQSATKVIFDRVVAATILMVLAPVFLGCVILTSGAEGEPTFASSTRIGRRGVNFRLLSFRTSPEQRLGVLLTRLGMDHLPELVNVLRGDMSLVGPRPTADRPDIHEGEVPADCRPGITGLWVLAPRADLSGPDAAMLDRRYVDSWSLARDIRILYRTVAAVRYGP